MSWMDCGCGDRECVVCAGPRISDAQAKELAERTTEYRFENGADVEVAYQSRTDVINENEVAQLKELLDEVHSQRELDEKLGAAVRRVVEAVGRSNYFDQA